MSQRGMAVEHIRRGVGRDGVRRRAWRESVSRGVRNEGVPAGTGRDCVRRRVRRGSARPWARQGSVRRAARHESVRRAACQDRGQVAVEFLGTTPLILLTLVLLWQFVLVGYTFTLAGNAADEAARDAALTHATYRQATCEESAREKLPASWIRHDVARCTTDAADHMVDVTVDLRVPVLFPGAIDFPFTVTAEASAVLEERY
ncbi:hypothetical protein GCM10014713_53180 [Streptomyces purpureus]|uniref:TadE-like domain-containing protein n=1 Tax=Streptomyces purpureus TaxID=1951 RepID=A0A918HC93_9ACTN|nr:TadE/TadG family type IV pilus assembly protein [Streptomyces purpureus]GGT52647.1 hypothetical protein GCM10014713_53180 [Streptomyces purpureus]